MITSRLRGHIIIYANNEWLYKDTETPTIGNERSCGYCEKPNTPEGHDGCLGTIPGVMNACCGHGKDSDAYIQYPNGNVARGEVALNEIELNGMDK